MPVRFPDEPAFQGRFAPVRLEGEIDPYLEAAAITIEDIGLRRPSLDEVFLALTGHTTTTAAVLERDHASNSAHPDPRRSA